MTTITEHVRAVVVRETGLDNRIVASDASFECMVLNPDDKIKVLSALEELYGLDFGDEEVASLHTIRDLEQYVSRRMHN